MASTTWRLRELSGASASVALTRIQLLNGSSDVMAGASITCTHAVMGDPLSALLDGSGSCVFDLSDAAQPGFAVTIALPAAVDADAINIQGDAVHGYALECLSGGVWVLASRKVQSAPIPMPSTFAQWRSNPVTAASQVTPLGFSSGGSVVVSPVSDGVGLSVSTYSVMLRIDPPIPWGEGEVWAEIRFKITADTLNRRHFGLWLYDPVNPTFGYRMATLDGEVVLSYFAGSFANGYETEFQKLLLPGGSLAVNATYVLRATVGLDRRVSAYLNGVLVGTFASPLQSGFVARAAGVYSYVGSYELYQIDVWTGGFFAPNRAMCRLATSVLASNVPPVPQGLQGLARYRPAKLIDVECGGQGRIYGTVARKNTPANVPLRRRVRLHRSVDGYLARETWSKADGSYEFREISTRYEWDVIAWDHELQEYSTVANNQLAEVPA